MEHKSTTGTRKSEHIQINLEHDVSGKGITTGLEHYRFVHQALPECNLSEIDLRTCFLKRVLQFPLLISSMTGGVEEGARINRNLARAAQKFGIAMGLGSGRIILEDTSTLANFRVRDVAPDVLLCANLGAVQLNYGVTVQDCQRLVDCLEADALILHLNPLQEAIQPEGNTKFADLFERIAEVAASLTVPVVVKEVGWGLSVDVIQLLYSAGISAVDVAGAGGTSWSEVERHRGDAELSMTASAFADWGIPTAEAIIGARRVSPDIPVVASGGIQSGVDMAKCIALGANVVGVAGPLLRAAVRSQDAVELVLRTLERQFRITMFCIGAKDLVELQQTRYIEDVRSWGTVRPERCVSHLSVYKK